MSRLGRVAALTAARLHPSAWRDRYGIEMTGLIEDADASLADAVDLARSALRAHTSGGAPMRFGPAHRHPGRFAAAATLLVLPTLVLVVLSLLGHEMGLTAVATVVDPWMTWVGAHAIADLAVVVAPAGALLLAVLPLVELSLERPGGVPALAVRVRAITANLLVAVVAMLVGTVLAWHVVVESVARAGA